jgi:hypothetical protein
MVVSGSGAAERDGLFISLWACLFCARLEAVVPRVGKIRLFQIELV